MLGGAVPVIAELMTSPYAVIIGGNVSPVDGKPTGLPRIHDAEAAVECPHILAWVKEMRGEA